MRKLLDFLISKRHWFIFLVLEIVSLVMIYRNNSYQRSIMLSSANVVTGYVSSVSASVNSYLNLRSLNKELLERNGQLEMKLLELQDQIDVMKADTAKFAGYAPDSTEVFTYHFVPAEVVNNSVSQIFNYITINKGRKDGITQDMGVVSDKGVVGIVSVVNDHFSVVLSILNPKFRLSCKIQRSQYFGSMIWKGRNIQYGSLEELPRHAVFKKGDIIVTSGYSAIFPPGILVGRIWNEKKNLDNNFYSLDVKLATNFATLKNVRIISNYRQAEQRSSEKEAEQND